MYSMPLLLDCSGVGLNTLVLGSALSLPAQPDKPAHSTATDTSIWRIFPIWMLHYYEMPVCIILSAIESTLSCP
jgi:hypothetical protein